MSGIVHDFPVFARRDDVFAAVSTPEGLDRWWTQTSAGSAGVGDVWTLGFGPDHQWEATVTACVAGFEIEWELTRAQEDWVGTRVALHLDEVGPKHTNVRFRHSGWRTTDAHFRTSSYCWAMYLRILKRAVEHGEDVAYDRRLDV